MVLKGKIIKGIGGFYYIKPCDCDDIIECKARGKFRNMSLVPIIGDVVDVELGTEQNKGSITKIYDRKNSFIRPSVANIDTLIIVVSCDNPKPDFAFIDKMLAIAYQKDVEAIICFNKTDLADEATVASYCKIYEDIGYKTITTSNIHGVDFEKVFKDILKGKTTVFTGFSGVGKSTLLNGITGSENMQTGEVSKKLGRGKHTTRHVELMEYKGIGYVVDTPGFSTLDLPDVDMSQLKSCFVEFDKYSDNCKFADCVHTSDRFCGVSDAVSKGLINKQRYDNYINFYNILKDKKEW